MEGANINGPLSAFDSPTFGQDGSFRLDKSVGSASISPCGRDIVLASRQGLHIIDLDSPYSPPRHLPHHTPWEVADVQWSPFAARDYWVVSTSNQKALVWNLGLANSRSSVEHVLHAHTRAITDINFSAHHPDVLATCAVDSFVHCWDIRYPARPAATFCDWFAGATQVKWNRQNSHILASSHDKWLRVWDDRKGAYPLRSIEAHDTKIYGVDWNRMKTTELVTCSLDRTVKVWDYEKQENDDSKQKPVQILNTPYPVWRARYTPFGFGLLVMPQRGDYNLHLYDRRHIEPGDESQLMPEAHQFDGHENHVKEFLWRTRGNVTDNIDDREFQLVSWGTDRILRLHEVDEHVLGRVGYEKGVNRNFNVTRRNAVYKSFRDKTPGDVHEDSQITEPFSGIGSALNAGISRASVSYIGGYGNRGFMSPVGTRKKQSPKDLDPISWMQGVKIGKRESSPSVTYQSGSSILSPSLKTDPSWEVFENLGEEITHVGEKFRKVKFDEIDVQGRRIVVSLSGPWGQDKASSYVKACVEFPKLYPNAAPPLVTLEGTASIDEEIEMNLLTDIEVITSGFASRKRSSLEAVLRYLLGEHTAEASLMWLKKQQQSVHLDLTQDIDLSSSDEDDDALGQYLDPRASALEGNDPLVPVSNAQYNVPLPKACGALWADNGLLICFFPSKPEKEASLLDLSIRSADRLSKYRKIIFEGFGRLQSNPSRQKRATSTLETIESGDSTSDDLDTSSSDSSFSSESFGMASHHLIPGMIWRSEIAGAHMGAALDDSQKSSGASGLERSIPAKGANYVSIHELSNLLPAKHRYAQKYMIGSDSLNISHNAQVAREAGALDLADVWSFVDLILQHRVPLELMNHPRSNQSVLIVARRAVSSLRANDSAIDLSFDWEEDQRLLDISAPVKWGTHPFGRSWLVQSLFRHFEQLADVQMLAMLSCIFSETQNNPEGFDRDKYERSPATSLSASISSGRYLKTSNDYYPSQEVAKAQIARADTDFSTQINLQSLHSGPRSATSSTGPPLSDMSTSGTPPSNYKGLRTNLGRRDSQAPSFSTSPEQLRHMYRSSSNLSALASSFKSSLPFSASAASSPPKTYSKKRLSPTPSYLGTSASSTTWNPSDVFGRSSTIVEDPKSALSLSVSDLGEEIVVPAAKPAFKVRLKNQDQFHHDDYASVTLLDPQQEWRYRAYREAYAHLLYIWDMPAARSKILNYDRPLSKARVPEESLSLLPIRRAGLPATTVDEANLVLDFKSTCKACGALIPLKSSHRRCSKCSVVRRSLSCILCNIPIHGLSSPCLNCGHVLHSSCRDILLALPDTDVAECPSGCGCICSKYAIIRLDFPEPPPAKPQHESSPAITILGDTDMNEQEQLGWNIGRHRPGNGTGNEEGEGVAVAAYESLTRNLQLRSRLEQGVRRSSSQIWRGRKGSRAGSGVDL